MQLSEILIIDLHKNTIATFEEDLVQLEELNTPDDDFDIDLESLKKSYFVHQQNNKEKCIETMKEIRDHLEKVQQKCDEQLETLTEIENSCMSINL